MVLRMSDGRLLFVEREGIGVGGEAMDTRDLVRYVEWGMMPREVLDGIETIIEKIEKLSQEIHDSLPNC